MLNKPYPDINLYSDDGSLYTKDSLLGKWSIVYFYPKDNTSGCTKQAVAFNNMMEQLQQYNTQVIGVSKDNATSHKKFKNTYQLSFPLLIDEQVELATYFDCWVEKSMYGRQYMGVERSSFLFNEQAICVYEWRKVKVPNHENIVLDTIKKMQ